MLILVNISTRTVCKKHVLCVCVCVCVCVCQTELSYRKRDYRPKENLQLNIQTNQEGLVALSAVDSALFTLRPNYRDPVTMVTQKTSHFTSEDICWSLFSTQAILVSCI